MSIEGVQPDPHKVEAVSQYPVPTTTKELKQFLGLIVNSFTTMRILLTH